MSIVSLQPHVPFWYLQHKANQHYLSPNQEHKPQVVLSSMKKQFTIDSSTNTRAYAGVIPIKDGLKKIWKQTQGCSKLIQKGVKVTDGRPSLE